MNQTARPYRRFRNFAVVYFLAFALAPLGCGGSDSVYPVKGEVFVDGQPAVGAEVVFHPVTADKDDPHFPAAVVGADGSFELTTIRASDGASPGDYKVTILWRDSRREDGETVYGPDKLGQRYENATASPIQVTVKPEKNVVPRFDLHTAR